MDFNAAEIVLLVLLAVIIFGPEKLPELARKTARVLHYVRTIANDARGQLREQLGPEFEDLHLSDLDPRSLLAQPLPGAADEFGEPAEAPEEDELGLIDPGPRGPTPFDPEAT